MPSAQFAARIVQELIPGSKITLERGALNGKTLGSYNQNPEGKLTVMSGDRVIASVVQAHVTEEQAPGPGLNELKQKLKEFALELE